MLGAPYWLIGKPIDDIKHHLREFDELLGEFMDAFREQEHRFEMQFNTKISEVMESTWKSKTFWFDHSLTSVNAMSILPYQYIWPEFAKFTNNDEALLSRFWCRDSKAKALIEGKRRDRDKYVSDLKNLFLQKGT
jgi:hypothetical protein